MLRRGIRRVMGPGERLTAPIAGEPWVVLVVSGVVRLYMSTGDGLEPSLVYGGPGSLLGSQLEPGGQPVVVGLQTVTASELVLLNAPQIERLAHADLRLAIALLDDARGTLCDIVQLCVVRASSTLAQRLAREIMLLDSLQPGALVGVTEQQLADGVGSIRESVARTIADFRRNELVATTRHGLLVLNRLRLADLASVSPR
ncbi:MAG: Crp/Fnr family transcriptional regulator [Candidatus Limnocylindrales bacterium]